MIEAGNNPGSLEFERLAAAIKRGGLDVFLGMRERPAAADGDPDWTRSS